MHSGARRAVRLTYASAADSQNTLSSGSGEIACSRRALLAAPLIAGIGSGFGSVRAATTDISDVPVFRGNPARTGEHPGPGPEAPLVGKWEIRLGKVLSS